MKQRQNVPAAFAPPPSYNDPVMSDRMAEVASGGGAYTVSGGGGGEHQGEHQSVASGGTSGSMGLNSVTVSIVQLSACIDVCVSA